jgi:hypothetical protein
VKYREDSCEKNVSKPGFQKLSDFFKFLDEKTLPLNDKKQVHGLPWFLLF